MYYCDVIKAFERGLRIVRVEDDSANEVYYEVSTEDEIFDNFDTEQEAMNYIVRGLADGGFYIDK